MKNQNFSTIFSKVICKVKISERITEFQSYGMTERTKINLRGIKYTTLIRSQDFWVTDTEMTLTFVQSINKINN